MPKTEKKQALQGSRLNAFSMDPDDLVLITEKTDPLYDARVELPIDEAMVLNIMAVGVLEPVIVRKRENEPIVIDGRRRVKHAREANRRLAKAGKETVMVPTIVRRGDEADAYTVTVSANEFRHQDERREKARKAQRLAQLGRSEGDIAVAMGVSVPTVQKLLVLDPKRAATVKKARGPSPRPPAAKVRRLLDSGNGVLSALVWNFVRGCRRVSAGCENCYAEAVAARFSGLDKAGMPLPYMGLAKRAKNGEPRWTGKGRFIADKLMDPLRWGPAKSVRHRVFVNSMSDLFFEEFTNEEIAAGFGVMASESQHDFLILTKRAKRMGEWFKWVERDGLPLHEIAARAKIALNVDGSIIEKGTEWPLPNVWLGVSCENQATADERIPELLATPAAVRWVSAEPLLGPVELFGRDDDGNYGPGWHLKSVKQLTDYGTGVEHDVDAQIGLDWVVVGGESGPGARPMDLAWARAIVEQCRAASVPVFVKQLGARPEVRAMKDDINGRPFESAVPFWLRDKKGGDPVEWPEDLRVREFPRTETAP